MNSGISQISSAMRVRVESGRIFSIFSLPTLYTFICSILLLAIFHYLINSKGKGAKTFWMILFLTGIFNLILAQSFAGILYLLVGFPVYLYLSGRSSLKFLIPLLTILSMFLFIIVGLRFSEAKKLNPVKLRISNWNQAVRMIEARPFFGNGLGNYEPKISGFTLPGEARSIYSHNFILQITAEGGIVVILLGLSLVILLRKKLIPEFNKGNALYISILLIILLYNLIDIGLYFFSASLMFSLILSQLYRKKEPLPKIIILITLILIIPQLLIFISSGVRRSGSFHLNFNRISRAEGYFQNSLHFNKFNHKSLLGLAKTSYAAGDYEKTNTYLKKVIELNDLNPYAHFLRSRVLYMKKKYLSSFYHAWKSISLNNRNSEYKAWYDFLNTNLSKNLKKPDSGGDTE